MRLAAAICMAAGLALAGCRSLPIPAAYEPTDPVNQPADKEPEYQAHAISRLGPTTYTVGGRDYMTQGLPRYLEFSGDQPNARLSKQAAWLHSIDQLTWLWGLMMPLLLRDAFRQPGAAGLGWGLAALSVGSDEHWALPWRAEAASGFDATLDQDLGLKHSVTPASLPQRLSPKGWSMIVTAGQRGVSNQDERDYFNRPDWQPTLGDAFRVGFSFGLTSPGGHGVREEGSIAARNQVYNYASGAKQTLALTCTELTEGYNYTWLLAPASGLSASAGLQAGLGLLAGDNNIVGSSGQSVGSEHLTGQAFSGGAHILVRRPITPTMAFGALAGYRWCRFDNVQSSGATGSLFGAQPGRTWAGAPEAWDFSGPELAIIIEIGHIPYGR